MSQNDSNETHRGLENSLHFAQERLRRAQALHRIIETRATAMFAIILASLGVVIGIIANIIIKIMTESEMELINETDSHAIYATMFSILMIIALLSIGLKFLYDATIFANFMLDEDYNPKNTDAKNVLESHISWTDFSYMQERILAGITLIHLKGSMRLVLTSIFIFLFTSLSHVLKIQIEDRLMEVDMPIENASIGLAFSALITIVNAIAFIDGIREKKKVQKEIEKFRNTPVEQYPG